MLLGGIGCKLAVMLHFSHDTSGVSFCFPFFRTGDGAHVCTSRRNVPGRACCKDVRVMRTRPGKLSGPGQIKPRKMRPQPVYSQTDKRGQLRPGESHSLSL